MAFSFLHELHIFFCLFISSNAYAIRLNFVYLRLSCSDKYLFEVFSSRLFRLFFCSQFVRFILCSKIMSYLHLASTANSSSSSTPSSYLHVNSNGGVSTIPSASIGSNSPSIFGSVGGGKQWTSIGQPSSSSSSSTLTQQLLMKQQQQQHLLNNQQTNSLNSSSSSSHFENLFGLTMASALQSSSQAQIEKNVSYIHSSIDR